MPTACHGERRAVPKECLMSSICRSIVLGAILVSMRCPLSRELFDFQPMTNATMSKACRRRVAKGEMSQSDLCLLRPYKRCCCFESSGSYENGTANLSSGIGGGMKVQQNVTCLTIVSGYRS